MFRFLFKIPQHKKFSHTPIYFDPAEEDLKKRLAKIEEEGKSNAARIERGSLKESWGHASRGKTSQGNRNSNIRFLVILFALAFVTWWILFSN